MNKTISFLVLILIQGIGFAQNIKIGDDAEYAKTLIEWSVSKQHKSNPFRDPLKPYWTSNSDYENGVLKSVTICKQKEFIHGLSGNIDYCETIIIKNKKVQYTITEFNNISLEDLKAFYKRFFYEDIINDLYFSYEFSNYYKFYVSHNGLATVECYETESSKLDRKILAQIELLKKKHTTDAIKNLMDDSKESEVDKMKREIDENNLEVNNIIKQDTLKQKTLIKRKTLTMPKPQPTCNEEGCVIVEVKINKDGKVLEAKAGISGTTNFAECLLKASEKAALNARFDVNYNAPEIQSSILKYNFILND